MRGFFKIFFASLLAMIVFCILLFFLGAGIVGSALSKDKPSVADNSVLVIDLSEALPEREQTAVFGGLTGAEDKPGLYDVIRLIKEAKYDKSISGIYLKADASAQGFAAGNELRNALLDFKSTRKFIIAYGDVMTQGAYFVANAANKIYVNPSGNFDWLGFNIGFVFLKGMLDKLEIQPQIFYAGKYKSATEIFRTEKMTPENRLQTNEWLGDIYQYFLEQSGKARGIDTATLHSLANTVAIQTPQDALQAKLVDGLKYDDEVKTEIKRLLGIKQEDVLNFTTTGKYAESVNLRMTGTNKIALIYAQGDIVDGKGDNDNIGGDTYRALIRKARLDKNVKAIVLRINSGGGSALASENIWRELQMAKTENKKPVVVSFGDVAASGGYYIGCGADSIFTNPNTITGSIGVFGIIPNLQNFFGNKLGITFDEVQTASHAGAGAIYKPLDETEKKLIQSSIERTYAQFLTRVASGRKKDTAYINTIAQGRVWSGQDAITNGLADKIGSLQDAIDCAARLAKLDTYGLREYPESGNWLDNLVNKKKEEPAAQLKEQLGVENFKIYNQLVKIRQLTSSTQARLPFEFIIH